jgi:hypothetical protein
LGPIFLLLTVLALVGGALALSRRGRGGWEARQKERVEREPWAASLEDDDAHDEPLDEDAIREAEDAFLERPWDGP